MDDNADDGALRRRFADARVAHLATADRAGRPHLVPMTFACCLQAGGDVIYSAVDAKPKSTRRLKRLANIAANPAVSVLVDHYDESWDQLWWVRADGVADVVTGGAQFNAGLEALAAKYRQYRDVRPAGPVVVVRVGAWRSWAAAG